MKKEYTVILEGMISVKAALCAKNRDIEKIWIDRRKRDDRRALGDLPAMARGRNVPVEYVPAETIDGYVRGKTSGGIIAFASERQHLSVDALLCAAPRGCLAALEGFEDPYNYGYAVRTLYAAGFDGLMTSRKTWNAADTIILRASAGASEVMPTALIEDYDEAVLCLREAGYMIVCAEQSRSSLTLYDAEFTLPCMVVIGGEKRGISKGFLQAADFFITIPYAREFPYALPGVSAVSVIAFEMFRRTRV